MGFTLWTMGRTGAAPGLTLKGGVSGLRNVGGTVHLVGDRRPVRRGYGIDEIAQALVLPDGDGKADIPLAADQDYGEGVEAAVARILSCPLVPAWRTRSTVSRRK